MQEIIEAISSIDIDKRYDAIPKLNGEPNYEVWLASVKIYCEQRGLSAHLDGTVRKLKPGTRSMAKKLHESLTRYHEERGQLMKLIRHTITGHVRKQVAVQLDALQTEFGTSRQILEPRQILNAIQWLYDPQTQSVDAIPPLVDFIFGVSESILRENEKEVKTPTLRSRTSTFSTNDSIHSPGINLSRGVKRTVDEHELTDCTSSAPAPKPKKVRTAFFASPLAERMEAMTTILNVGAGKNLKAFFAKLKPAFRTLGKSGLDVSNQVIVPFVLAKLAVNRRDIVTVY